MKTNSSQIDGEQFSSENEYTEPETNIVELMTPNPDALRRLGSILTEENGQPRITYVTYENQRWQVFGHTWLPKLYPTERDSWSDRDG
jgi:hypothetical protein